MAGRGERAQTRCLPESRPGLLELLLLQNAQVHQLLLCRLAEGALDFAPTSFDPQVRGGVATEAAHLGPRY